MDFKKKKKEEIELAFEILNISSLEQAGVPTLQLPSSCWSVSKYSK